MRWLWPGGLVARVAIVMAIALLVVQSVSISFYLRDQARAATTLFTEFNAERIASLVATLESLTRSQRTDLLPAINSPTLAVMLSESGPSSESGDKAATLTLLLEAGLDRPVVLADARDTDLLALPDPFASQRKLAHWVRLQDGQWVRFVSPSSLPSLGWVMHMSAILGLVSLLLIAFVAWAVHRLTRPIRTFAAAAEKLGTDTEAPHIDVPGSRELEQAGKAFNTMARRLQRYVNDRTEMLAAISHDLRTCITRLQLRIQFIEDEEQARKAQLDIEQMEAMLAATLAFARDDAAAEPLSRVDLASMLQTLCDDLTDQGYVASYQGPISLDWDCRPLALERALNNLANNAVGHGDRAELSMSESGDGIEIRIRDRGKGVREEDLDRVFEPFVRLDPARNQASGGSGLGLSIARSAVHSLGGRRIFRNHPEGGLEASIHLPR